MSDDRDAGLMIHARLTENVDRLNMHMLSFGDSHRRAIAEPYQDFLASLIPEDSQAYSAHNEERCAWQGALQHLSSGLDEAERMLREEENSIDYLDEPGCSNEALRERQESASLKRDILLREVFSLRASCRASAPFWKRVMNHGRLTRALKEKEDALGKVNAEIDDIRALWEEERRRRLIENPASLRRWRRCLLRACRLRTEKEYVSSAFDAVVSGQVADGEVAAGKYQCAGDFHQMRASLMDYLNISRQVLDLEERIERLAEAAREGMVKCTPAIEESLALMSQILMKDEAVWKDMPESLRESLAHAVVRLESLTRKASVPGTRQGRANERI